MTPRLRAAVLLCAAGAALLFVLALFLRREPVDDFRESGEASALRPEEGLRAPGAPIGVLEEPAPAAPTPLKAPALPPPAESVSSNEEAHARLERERAQMGIRQIVAADSIPQEEERPAQDVERDRPMNRQEAMAYMREMTATLARINQMRRNQNAPAVPVQGNEKPRLMANSDDSRPLGQTDAPPAETADSVGYVRGQTLHGSKPPAQQLELPMEIAHTTARSPKEEGGPLPRVKEGTTDFRWRSSQSWAGAAAGLPPGGSTVRETPRWAALWARVGRGAAPPPVDFQKQMVLALFGAPDGKGVEILSVKPQGPTLWVSWRRTPSGAPSGQGAYHIVAVPASGLQVSFEQVK